MKYSLNGFTFPEIKPGKATNIEEFIDLVIRPQFKNRDVIRNHHEALTNYINSEKATFFIRAHASYKKERYSLLRRGFLTRYADGISYAFCDNTFTMLFVALKAAGIKFDACQLHNYFNAGEVICGYSDRNEFPVEYSQMRLMIMEMPLPRPFYDEPVSAIEWRQGFTITPGMNKEVVLIPVPTEEQIKSKEVETEKVPTIDLLRRMGSEAFIYCYLPLKADINVDMNKLASCCPNHTGWTENSKRSRASVAKRIFREGRVQEALALILKQNLDADLKSIARRYLEEYEEVNIPETKSL